MSSTLVNLHQMTEADEQEFSAMFPDIVAEIVSGPPFSNVPEIGTRLKKLLEYNTLGGSKIRGLVTVQAYKMLENPENITEESMKLARILGWCVELFQTSLIILDDVADNSLTRRGQACWYRLQDTGFIVVNDSLLMLTVVFNIIKKYFGNRGCYPEMIHLFHEALAQLCIGQYPTVTYSKDYKQFTMENYRGFSDSKITFYTFKLPVYLGLLLAGKPYKNAFNSTDDIVAEMGIAKSIQNDYMDCFGDENVSGKAGNDIEEGKCTWLAVTALQRSNASQRAEFTECYGSADQQRVQRVKQLYKELELPVLYHNHQKTTYDNIIQRLKYLPADNALPSTLLKKIFEMVFKIQVD